MRLFSFVESTYIHTHDILSLCIALYFTLCVSTFLFVVCWFVRSKESIILRKILVCVCARSGINGIYCMHITEFREKERSVREYARVLVCNLSAYLNSFIFGVNWLLCKTKQKIFFGMCQRCCIFCRAIWGCVPLKSICFEQSITILTWWWHFFLHNISISLLSIAVTVCVCVCAHALVNISKSIACLLLSSCMLCLENSFMCRIRSFNIQSARHSSKWFSFSFLEPLTAPQDIDTHKHSHTHT